MQTILPLYLPGPFIFKYLISTILTLHFLAYHLVSWLANTWHTLTSQSFLTTLFSDGMFLPTHLNRWLFLGLCSNVQVSVITFLNILYKITTSHFPFPSFLISLILLYKGFILCHCGILYITNSIFIFSMFFSF